MATENNAEVSIRFKNKIDNEKDLQKYAETLTKIRSTIAGLDSKTLTAIETSSKEISKVDSATSKIGRNISSAFNYGVIRQFVSGLRTAVTQLGNLTDKSSDYLENINLFQVAFNGAYQEAEKLINEMSEMYGLDESNLTKTVGLFKQLSNAMNISAETGNKLSTLLTQMTVDISSLYNIDISRASSVLQSTMAGQTKPIRGATGADITEATLQTTLDTLGIDRYVGDLSYAEKRLLIVISLTDQLSESIGDFAKTIESPANQTRVLNEQWQRLSRSVGNLFLPILTQILPYLNAILMVLTEIISGLAILFGYNQEDYDYFAGITDSAIDLEESLGGASENAKKLKQGLRGFDKLNVITTPSSSSSSSGVSSTGNIDPKLMEEFNKAFDSYNSKLTDVQMKATKIRDRIMEWLGFTKEIDPLTGDISWKYEGTNKTVDRIVKAVEKIWENGKNIVTDVFGTLWKDFTSGFWGDTIILVLEGIGNGLEWINKHKSVKTLLGRILEIMISLKGLKILTKLTGLNNLLKGPFKTTLENIVKKFDKVETSADGAEKTTNKLKDGFGKLKDAMSKIATGATLTVTGLLSISTAMEDINENGFTVSNTLMGVSGLMETTFGGATIGSIFGHWGTVIGGAIGLITGLTTAIIEAGTRLDSETQKLYDSIEETTKRYEELQEAKQKTLDESDSEFKYYEDLYTELQKITEENGNIKTGYEDRANVITGILSKALGIEIEIIDGQIKKYDELEKSIKDVITQKKAQIWLEAYEEEFAEAIKTKTDVTNQLTEAITNQSSAQDYYNELLKKASKETGYSEKQLKNWSKNGASAFINSLFDVTGQLNFYLMDLYKAEKALDDSNDMLEEARDNYEQNAQAISNYQTAYGLAMNGNYEDLVEYLESERKLLDASTLEKKRHYMDEITLLKDNLEELERNKANYTTEEYENEKIRYENLLKLNQINLSLLVKDTKDITPEMVDAWGSLAQSSEEEFMRKFLLLPQDIQEEIVDKMYDKGYSISEELQKGIDALNIDINIDESNFKSSGALAGNAWQNSFTSALNKKIQIKQEISTDIKTGAKEDKYGYIKVSAWANGGLPPVGQLFVANERGPELVGQIGGQSFVANQNQMMDLLDRKIGNANGGVQNATFIIQVGDENIGRVTLNKLQDIAKSNGKPIIIGG